MSDYDLDDSEEEYRQPFTWSGGSFGCSHPGYSGELRNRCASDDVEGVREILDVAQNVTPGYCAELVAACENGNAEIIRMLLSVGADIRSSKLTRNKWGEYSDLTAFQITVARNHVDAARVCLDYGAEVNSRDDFGCTPLWRASVEGRLELVRLLLDRGADIGPLTSDGKTPLYAACTGSHPELRSQATEHEHCDVVRLLLARGADANRFTTGIVGGTVLHSASEMNMVRMMRILLDHGANPHLKDNYGRTAFDVFQWNTGSREVAALLRKYVAIQVRTCVLGKHPRRDRLRDLVPRVASYVV